MKARIVLEVTNTFGQPISHVVVGQTFLLNLSVQDLRPEGQFIPTEGLYAGKVTNLIRGVYAAYCDVSFPVTQVRVKQVGPKFMDAFTFPYPYINGKTACKTTGGIRWWGAFSDVFAGLGTGLEKMSSALMVATAPGTVQFKPMLNSLGPAWDFLVYGNLLANPIEESKVERADVKLEGVTIQVQ